jgi:hypothetical protein
MCTLLCHIVTSHIPSQSVRIAKIKRGPLVCIISWDVNSRKCDERGHRSPQGGPTACLAVAQISVLFPFFW